MDKKIAFVYDTLHPLHKKLFNTVDCDFFSISKKLPKNYDIYIFEGTYIKPILLKRFRKINKNAKIVTLFSDPRLFYLSIGKKFDFKKNKMVKYPKWRFLLAKKIIKDIDGAICIGDFSENLFRKFNRKVPVLNIPGFVFKKRANNLFKIRTNLKNKNILFIGYGPDYHVKGIDIMIDVFKKVKEKIFDAKLYILGGDWNPKKEWLVEGIHFEGVQNITSYFKKSSLTVHFGRGESFGLNILESMLAGVPVIVSKYTGAKQVVEKVSKNMVVDLNKDDIVKDIIKYFNLSLIDKKGLSEKCREIAKEFDEEKTLKTFKEKFNKFINSIS